VEYPFKKKSKLLTAGGL